MPQIPDRLHIDKEDRKLYDELDKENMLKFKDNGGRRTRKEQFIFSMVIGYKNTIKRPLDTKDGFFNTRDMRLEDEALINAIAINDNNSVDVLANREEVFQIAEEYAHAGIRLLHDKIKSTQLGGSFDKQFEKELIDIYKELDLGENGEKDTSG